MIKSILNKFKSWCEDATPLSLEAALILEKVVLVSTVVVIGAILYVFTFNP